VIAAAVILINGNKNDATVKKAPPTAKKKAKDKKDKGKGKDKAKGKK